MIFWLDNNENHMGAPNENYGRELLELFSLGVGNYTEDDIKNAAKMESAQVIQHFNQHVQKEETSADWLPEGDVVIGITAGASCPNNLIEDAIRRLFELKSVPLESAFPEEIIGMSKL